MINSAIVLDGFAAKLPALKDKKFLFNADKISILFGKNGCGKTSLLKIMAAYCSIENGGWSRILNPPFDNKQKYPDRYSEIAPGRCKAKVKWDGTPSFLLHQDKSDAVSYFVDNEEESDDGITSYWEQVSLCLHKPSQGEIRLSKLLKFKKAVEKGAPDLIQHKYYKDGKFSCNEVWAKSISKQFDYISSLPRTGIPTFLLDEPDKSLSIDNQILLWTKFIPSLAKIGQVIVATHCFVPLIKDLNFQWYEMEDRYVDKCKSEINKLLKG